MVQPQDFHGVISIDCPVCGQRTDVAQLAVNDAHCSHCVRKLSEPTESRRDTRIQVSSAESEDPVSLSQYRFPNWVCTTLLPAFALLITTTSAFWPIPERSLLVWSGFSDLTIAAPILVTFAPVAIILAMLLANGLQGSGL